MDDGQRIVITVEVLERLLERLREDGGDDGPTRTDMVSQLHEAVHGDSWARADSPAAVWEDLLRRVRARFGT